MKSTEMALNVSGLWSSSCCQSITAIHCKELLSLFSFDGIGHFLSKANVK